MAVLSRPKIGPQQRFDLEDFLALLSSLRTDAKLWTKSMQSSTNQIMGGFAITGIGLKSATVLMADAALVIPENSNDFSFFISAPAEPDIIVPDSDLTDNARNFLEIELCTEDNTPLTKAFWDPEANSGAGAEFNQIVNTVTDLKINIVTSTSGFSGSPDRLPLAIIDTDGTGNIKFILDRRNLFGRLAIPSDLDNEFTWGTKSEPAYSLVMTGVSGTFTDGETINIGGETATVVTGGTTTVTFNEPTGINFFSGDSVTGTASGATGTIDTVFESFSGVDKSLDTQDDVNKALMTEIKGLKGSRFWWDDTKKSIQGLVDELHTVIVPTTTAQNPKWSWSGTDLSITDDNVSPAVSDQLVQLRTFGGPTGVTFNRQDGQASTVTLPIGDGEVLFINRTESTIAEPGTGSTNFQTVDSASYVQSDENFWLATRVGSRLFLRGVGELQSGESAEISDNINENILTAIGLESETSLPNYTSTKAFPQNSSLVAAVSALDELAGDLAWKTPVADFASLPPTGNNDGDVRLTLDTNVRYRWNDAQSQWVPISGGGNLKMIGGGTFSVDDDSGVTLGPVSQNGGPTGAITDGGQYDLDNQSGDFPTALARFNNLGALTPTANNYRIDRIEWRMLKTGSPSGTVRAVIYEGDGTFVGSVVGTSDPVDVSTIGTGPAFVVFNFSSTVDLDHTNSNGGYMIGLSYDPGFTVDGSNFVSVGLTPTAPPPPPTGIFSFNSNTTSWDPISILQPWFQVYSAEVMVTGSGDVELAFTEDICLEKPGLQYSDNVIPVAESPIAFDANRKAAYVEPNLTSGGGGTSPVSIQQLDDSDIVATLSNGESFYQTFTPTQNFQLNSITVNYRLTGTPAPNNTVLELVQVSGGVPTDTVLFTSDPENISSTAGGLVQFDFASVINVVAGTEYAWRLTNILSGGIDIELNGLNTTNPYATGKAYKQESGGGISPIYDVSNAQNNAFRLDSLDNSLYVVFQVPSSATNFSFSFDVNKQNIATGDLRLQVYSDVDGTPGNGNETLLFNMSQNLSGIPAGQSTVTFTPSSFTLNPGQTYYFRIRLSATATPSASDWIEIEYSDTAPDTGSIDVFTTVDDEVTVLPLGSEVNSALTIVTPAPGINDTGIENSDYYFDIQGTVFTSSPPLSVIVDDLENVPPTAQIIARRDDQIISTLQNEIYTQNNFAAGLNNLGGNTLVGLTFTPTTSSTNVTKVGVALRRGGTPGPTGNISARLINTTGGTPDDTSPIATSSTVLDATVLDFTATVYEFEFAGVSLNAGTEYAIELDFTGITSSIDIFGDSANNNSSRVWRKVGAAAWQGLATNDPYVVVTETQVNSEKTIIVGTSSSRLAIGESMSLYNSKTDQDKDRSRGNAFGYMRSDEPITWTGTELIFTQDILLELINRDGIRSTHSIALAGSPIAVADGESVYVTVDRTQTTEVITPVVSSTIPTIPAAGSEIYVLFERRDASGAGYLHLPFSKQVIEPGQSVRIGASGSGSGGANSFIDQVEDILQGTTYEAATPYVAEIDQDDANLVDPISTGAYSLVDRRFGLPLIGDTLVSAQMLDDTFLNDNQTLEKIRVLLKFDDNSGQDPAPVVEASRNSGAEYQAITMEQVDSSPVWTGNLEFAQEATQNTLSGDGSIAGSNLEMNATTGQAYAQPFTLAAKTLVRKVFGNVQDIVGTLDGTISARIVADDGGAPSLDANDIIIESAPVSLSSVVAGEIEFGISPTILAAGDYHVVYVTDAAYKSIYDDGNIEFSLGANDAGTGAQIFDGTSWSIIGAEFSLTHRVEGYELDLKIRVTSSVTDVLIEGFGVFYGEEAALSANPVLLEGYSKVSFQAVTDNTNEFILPFLPDQNLIVRLQGSGQSFIYGDFALDNNRVIFPEDQFNNGGIEITQTLIFDNLRGGGFDNSDLSRALLAANHLSSLDPGNDLGIAGRGIILKSPDGTKYEITIKDGGVGFDIFEVS